MLITNSKDIFGQDSVITFLKNLIIHQNLPQIIWLTGDSGSGKSTIAEWLALTYTCESHKDEPCLECKTCRDNLASFNNSLVRSSVIRKLNLAELLSKKEVKDVVEQIFDIKTFDDRRTFFIFEEMQELTGFENLFLERMRLLPDNIYIIGCTTNLKALSVPFQTRGQATLNISRLNKKSALSLIYNYAQKIDLLISERDANLLISKARNNARVITQTLNLMKKNNNNVKETLRMTLNYINLTIYVNLLTDMFKELPNFMLCIYELQEEIDLVEFWKNFHPFLIDFLYFIYADIADVFNNEEKEKLLIIKDNLTLKQLRKLLAISSKYTSNENIVIQHLIEMNEILTTEEYIPLTIEENVKSVTEEKLFVQEQTTFKKYEDFNSKEESLNDDIVEDLLNRGGVVYDNNNIVGLL